MAGQRLHANFVLGYHGCLRAVGERLIQGEPFKKSENDYDWLGHGIYFWESYPDRALSFIRDANRRKGIPETDAFVVGAVIDLGYSMDLLSESSIDLLKDAYESMKKIFEAGGVTLPVNRLGSDLLLRPLDCAVINYLHASRDEDEQLPFETVRGLFVEGEPIFEGSGFRSKTHVQICVREPRNIKGVFKVVATPPD